MTYKEPSGTSENNYAALFTNFTWFSRYNLAETDNTSLSIGAPLGAGIGIANGSYSPSVYFGFDIPLVLDYNIGFKSSHENENKPGFYFGTGFGYTITNWTDGSSMESLSTYGPLLRGGIRIGGGTENHPERGTAIALSFKWGLEEQKSKTYGIGVFWDF